MVLVEPYSTNSINIYLSKLHRFNSSTRSGKKRFNYCNINININFRPDFRPWSLFKHMNGSENGSEARKSPRGWWRTAIEMLAEGMYEENSTYGITSAAMKGIFLIISHSYQNLIEVDALPPQLLHFTEWRNARLQLVLHVWRIRGKHECLHSHSRQRVVRILASASRRVFSSLFGTPWPLTNGKNHPTVLFLVHHIQSFMKSCIHWLSARGGVRIPRLLGPEIHTSKPNELIKFDYLDLVPRKTDEKYVLITLDNLSSYTWL